MAEKGTKMIDKTVFLKLLLILGLLMISAVSVSAQDIDVSTMDNAELLELLQAILNKLETEETEGTAEPLPEGTAVPVISVARFSDGKLFTIYENKKLILERIPDSYFVQKDNGGDGDKEEGPKPTTTPKSPCAPGCDYECWIGIYGRPECGCVCG